MPKNPNPKSWEDFYHAARDNNLLEQPMGDCSICGYMLAFQFHPDYLTDEEAEAEGTVSVCFDAGCHCVGGPSTYRDSSWEDVANHYNRQTSETYINTLNSHYSFNKEDLS